MSSDSSILHNAFTHLGSVFETLKSKVSHVDNGGPSGGSKNNLSDDIALSTTAINAMLIEKPERMALLLLAPELLFGSSQSSSLFGKLLVGLSAAHQLVWAATGLSIEEGGAIAHWAKKHGVKLSGNSPSDHSIAWISVFGLGVSAAAAMIAAIHGPHHHPLTVLVFGVQKIGIVLGLLLQARVHPDFMDKNPGVIELTRFSVRSGILLILYGLLLLWRSRRASEEHKRTPHYIEILEKN